MRYRGFEITTTIDRGIIRHNYNTGEDDICNGYYCQIYPAGDDSYAHQLDDFCLAEKYDIPDLTERSLNEAIIGYVDGWYEDLVAEKNDVKSNRIYATNRSLTSLTTIMNISSKMILRLRMQSTSCGSTISPEVSNLI